MEYKKTTLRIIIGAFIGIIIGVLLANLRDMGLCGSSFCRKILENSIAAPLMFFSLSILPVAIILYFLREATFRSWLRFTKWYLPLAALAILLSLGSHGGWGVGNIFDTELVTMFSAGIFFVLSLVLIVTRSCSRK